MFFSIAESVFRNLWVSKNIISDNAKKILGGTTPYRIQKNIAILRTCWEILYKHFGNVFDANDKRTVYSVLEDVKIKQIKHMEEVFSKDGIDWSQNVISAICAAPKTLTHYCEEDKKIDCHYIYIPSNIFEIMINSYFGQKVSMTTVKQDLVLKGILYIDSSKDYTIKRGNPPKRVYAINLTHAENYKKQKESKR